MYYQIAAKIILITICTKGCPFRERSVNFERTFGYPQIPPNSIIVLKAVEARKRIVMFVRLLEESSTWKKKHYDFFWPLDTSMISASIINALHWNHDALQNCIIDHLRVGYFLNYMSMTSKNWRIFSVNVRFVPKPVRYHFQKFGLRPCTPQKSVTTRALNLFRSRIQIRMHILPVIKNGYYNGAWAIIWQYSLSSLKLQS